MDTIREIEAIGQQEFRRTARGGRIVVLLLFYLGFCVLSLFFLEFQNGERRVNRQVASGEMTAEEARAEIDLRRDEGLKSWSDDAEAREAVAGIPLSVLSLFRFTLFFLPLYVALMGFDQISGEVAGKSIRYVTIRAKRISVLLGKYSGQAMALLALTFLLELLILIYAKATYPLFGVGLAALTLIKLTAWAFIASLPFLALSSFCSTAFKTPMVSLTVNIMGVLGLWAMELIGFFVHKLGDEGGWKIVSSLRFASPQHYTDDLIHPSINHWGLAMLAYLGFSLLFLAAGWAILRVRDV